MRLDPKLKEFGNATQAARVDAVNEYGSFMKAGKALGVSETAIKQSIDILKRNAALQGYSPEHDMNRLVPQGFKVKGVSTYYNAEGKPSGQWSNRAQMNSNVNRSSKKPLRRWLMSCHGLSQA